MAIQMRRGSEADFDGSQLLPGEIAICTDTDTLYYKGATVQKMSTANDIGFHAMKIVTMSGITSLPKTFTAQGITADHKLIQEGSAYVSPRSSMANKWTLETSTNQVRVLGTFSGSTPTTIIATMGIPNDEVTGVAQ